MAATQPLTDQEKTQAKEMLARIGDRLRNDSAFHDRYKAAPAATLKAEGVPDAVISALRARAAQKKGEEVSGYIYDWDLDDPTSSGAYWDTPWEG